MHESLEYPIVVNAKRSAGTYSVARLPFVMPLIQRNDLESDQTIAVQLGPCLLVYFKLCLCLIDACNSAPTSMSCMAQLPSLRMFVSVS